MTAPNEMGQNPITIRTLRAETLPGNNSENIKNNTAWKDNRLRSLYLPGDF